MSYLFKSSLILTGTECPIINELTFIGKSTTLFNFFSHRLSVNSNSLSPQPPLAFLIVIYANEQTSRVLRWVGGGDGEVEGVETTC